MSSGLLDTTKAVESGPVVEEAKRSICLGFTHFRETFPLIILDDVAFARFGCFLVGDATTSDENLAEIGVDSTAEGSTSCEHISSFNWSLAGLREDLKSSLYSLRAVDIIGTTNQEHTTSGQSYSFAKNRHALNAEDLFLIQFVVCQGAVAVDFLLLRINQRFVALISCGGHKRN